MSKVKHEPCSASASLATAHVALPGSSLFAVAVAGIHSESKSQRFPIAFQAIVPGHDSSSSSGSTQIGSHHAIARSDPRGPLSQQSGVCPIMLVSDVSGCCHITTCAELSAADQPHRVRALPSRVGRHTQTSLVPDAQSCFSEELVKLHC